MYRDESNVDWVPTLFMNGEKNLTKKEQGNNIADIKCDVYFSFYWKQQTLISIFLDEESQNATAYFFTSTTDIPLEDNYITVKEEVLTNNSFEG